MPEDFKLDPITRLVMLVEGLTLTVNELKDAVQEASKANDLKYVTKQEFGPVKLIVFGFTGLILTTIVLAGLTYLLKGKLP